MNREILKCRDLADTAVQPPVAGIKDWLGKQAQDHSLSLLLAHAYDGVIWGRWDGAQLATSYQAEKDAEDVPVSAPLDDDTLQEARLFSETAELHIWRSGGGGWNGRLIRPAKENETPTYTEYIAECHILWGDQARSLNGASFTRLSDGIQGLRHVVPLALKKDRYEERPLRLKLRHYLAQENFARIAASRLVGLTAVPKECEK